MIDAYDELIEYLEEGETVERIVFSRWGFTQDIFADYEDWVKGIPIADPVIVPFDNRAFPMRLDEAKEYMLGWSFYTGDFSCYATYVWTNKRRIWVNPSWEGYTYLESIQRAPSVCEPEYK